jgi:Tol biopolymer transport system component
LGISGGLVPCPDAIAILLIAVTINRISFGLSLILAFSLGLAVILILIGLLIVQGKRLFQRLRWFDRVAYVVPVLSALVVLGLGAALTAGAVQRLPGLPGEMEMAPSFDLKQARVIYVAPDEDKRFQLFIVPVLAAESDRQPEQITAGEGIWRYADSPDGDHVIFTTSNGLDSSQLWQWMPATGSQTLLLDCPGAFCSGSVWSPDGQGILYSRLDRGAQANPAGIPSIWWLDLTTGETSPLFQDAQMPGFDPRLSPVGHWLSYTAINPPEIQIYDMVTGVSHSLPSQTGAPVVWSPAEETLLLVDLEKDGESYSRKLFRYDLATRERSALNTGRAFDEDDPAWSPDGQWIALVRREWGPEAPPDEDQIWLMRPDGSEAQPVTQDREILHGHPVWSPDGRHLLYEVGSTNSASDYQGIWLLELETGEVCEIAAPGYRPAWVP